jgi:hypothetical protein
LNFLGHGPGPGRVDFFGPGPDRVRVQVRDLPDDLYSRLTTITFHCKTRGVKTIDKTKIQYFKQAIQTHLPEYKLILFI